MTPVGFRLSRAKGWRMPAHGRSVARPTRWGNTFVIGDGQISWRGTSLGARVGHYDAADRRHCDLPMRDGLTAHEAVQLYRDDLEATLADADVDARAAEIVAALEELRGWDLGCWCPLHEPCHRNVLLDLANR